VNIEAIIHGAVGLLKGPSGAAIAAVMLSIAFTQGVRLWAHRNPRFRAPGNGLTKAESRFIAWAVTAVSFPFVCWAAEIPVRENILVGIAAGVVSPVIIALLKMVADKTGWPIDLDRLLGMEDEPAPK
jgi:hypothetical protein